MSFIWNLIAIVLTYLVCFPVVIFVMSITIFVHDWRVYLPDMNGAIASLGIVPQPWMESVVLYVLVMTAFGLAGAALQLLPPTWAVVRYLVCHARKPNAAQAARIQAALDYMEARSGRKLARQYKFFVYSNDFNAFATGWRDIIIGVPLLEKLTTPQLAGILAHEMGHHVHGDIKSQFFIGSLFLLLQLCLAFLYVISWVCANILGRLPYLGFVFSLISLVLSLFQAVMAVIYAIPYRFLDLTINRRVEFAADAHAVKLGLGEELISGLQLLIDDCGDTPWYMVPFADHPRGKSRIRRVEQLVEKERQKAINASAARALKA